MKKNIVILCFMILNLVHAESTNWQDKKISFIYDKLPLCSMAQKIGLATKLPVVFFGTENFQKKYVDITPHPKTVQEMIIKLQKLRPGFTIKKEGNVLVIMDQKHYLPIFLSKFTIRLNNQSFEAWYKEHQKEFDEQKIDFFVEEGKSSKITADYIDKPLNEIFIDLAKNYGGMYFFYSFQIDGNTYTRIIHSDLPSLPEPPVEGLKLPAGSNLLSVKAEIQFKDDIAYCHVMIHNISKQKLFFHGLSQHDLFIAIYGTKKIKFKSLMLFNKTPLSKTFFLNPNEKKAVVFSLENTEGYLRSPQFRKTLKKPKKIIYPVNCVTPKDRQKYLFTLISKIYNRFTVYIKFSDEKKEQYWSRSIRGRRKSLEFTIPK